ncbi:MAG: hypothetical protein AAGH82_08875 [Pseudomonadota bacterium]
MSAVASLQSYTARIPAVSYAHWLIRLPVAAYIINQGYIKFPLLADDAVSFGVPYFMWVLAAVGEVAAGVGLIVGGFMMNRWGDLLTRASAGVMALIVASVIVVVYYAPIFDIFMFNQFQVLLLVGALFFLLRGNELRRDGGLVTH